MFLRFNILRDLLNEITFKMARKRTFFKHLYIFLKIIITKTKLIFYVCFMHLYFYNEEYLINKW